MIILFLYEKIFKGRDYQKCYDFKNGYSASVVRNQLSYGSSENLFEVAVLKGNEFCYDSPITNDVVGWCTAKDVRELLSQIKRL